MMPLRLGIVQYSKKYLFHLRTFLLDVARPTDVYTFTQPGGQFADGRLNDLQRTKQVARIPPTGGISSIRFNVGGLVNWPHG